MSEENKHEGAVSDEGLDNAINWEEKVQALEAQNQRLLNESKKMKTRHEEVEKLRVENETFKKQQLEVNGSWEEKLQFRDEKINELKAEAEKLKKKSLRSNIINAIGNVAKDVRDVNDLINQPEFVKMIEVDEETLEPTHESVANFVNTLKEKKDYLFAGKPLPPMGDANPKINAPKIKPLSQMTRSELAEVRQAKLKTMN